MKGDGFPKEYFKIRSSGLPKNGKPKDSFGRASEERKPKDSRSDGLPIWWASEERKTKKPRFVRSGGVGFRPSGKEEPRFDRDWVEWASDLREKKNQDSIGWASDLWEKRNQDSIGWSGLPTFGKRRTKIRLGCLRCLLKNGKNQRFISSGGLLKNNQRFIYTNT
ncbi:unnamed protein product [Rhizophagus irregularis]|nr:unnamed protein product [Rhizophagus irregularis]